MKLEILISTYGADGIRRLSRKGALPAVEGVGYLISWQRGDCDAPVPEALKRDDVRVVEAPGRGLGANRDNALTAAIGEVCLLSDDDLVYHPDGLRRLIDKMAEHSEIDYALVMHDGGDRRYYPAAEYQLDRMACGHFMNEVDLAFRLDAVRRVGARFNHRFGVGAEFPSGEGYLWLYQLRKGGLRGRFFPIRVATHPGLTTNERLSADSAVLRSEGVLVAVQYPVTGLLRLPLVAWRRVRWTAPKALMPLLSGYTRALLRPRSLGL